MIFDPIPLSRLRIVLVEPAQPRNIGASARALKTMGITRLYLVRPREYPHVQAEVLAVSAVDVLDRASVHDDLASAVAGCVAVYAVSARQRRIPLPWGEPREMAPQIITHARSGDVAVVFGSEEAGLSSADLDLCGSLVQIPSDPACRSLNLAAAVQVLAYELRLAAALTAPSARQDAPIETLEGLLSALEETLQSAGFFANKNQMLAMLRLRRILQRAQPDRAELNLLRGALKQVRRQLQITAAAAPKS